MYGVDRCMIIGDKVVSELGGHDNYMTIIQSAYVRAHPAPLPLLLLLLLLTYHFSLFLPASLSLNRPFRTQTCSFDKVPMQAAARLLARSNVAVICTERY